MGAVLQEQYQAIKTPEEGDNKIGVVFSPADPSLVFIHTKDAPSKDAPKGKDRSSAYNLATFIKSLENNEVLPDGRVLLKYTGDSGVTEILLSDQQFDYVYDSVQKHISKREQTAESQPDETDDYPTEVKQGSAEQLSQNETFFAKAARGLSGFFSLGK